MSADKVSIDLTNVDKEGPAPKAAPDMVRLSATDPAVMAALDVYDRGNTPLALRPREKAPIERDWQRLTFTDRDELLRYLTVTGRLLDTVGLGVRLGDGLADVDLDSPAALLAASLLLPPTAARSGRPGNPNSHWWYRLDADSGGQAPYVKHTLSDGSAVVELRADRLHQTAIPPTVHPSGELYRWEGEPWGGDSGPAEISAALLREAVDDVALVAALIPGWPDAGNRHDAYLALAGALLRAWQVPRVIRVLTALAKATNDEEYRKRVGEVVPSTARKLASGTEKVTGWPVLETLTKDSKGVTLGRTLTENNDGGDDEHGLYRDLSKWADPNFRPPKIRPDLLLRTDGLGLFYRLRINYLYGPSEQGKTWVALAAVAIVLRAGGSVLWMDLDDMDDELPLRLRMLGVPHEVFANGQFRMAEIADLRHIIALQEQEPPDLMVLDGMTVLFAMAGGRDGSASNSPDVVSQTMAKVTKPWLRNGRTTLILIDHTNKKSKLEDGPTGAATKMNTVRGSMIGVSASTKTRPLPGGKGHFSLWLYKEMPAVLRKDSRARGAKELGSLVDIGRLELESTNPDDDEAPSSLRVTVLPPLAEGSFDHSAADAEIVDETLQEKIEIVLQDDPGSTGSEIEVAVKGRRERVLAQLEGMQRAGLITPEPCIPGCTVCRAKNRRTHKTRQHFYVKSVPGSPDSE